MKKGVGKKKRMILSSLFIVLLVFTFLSLIFFDIPSTGGDFVKWGDGPYYYNCSNCSECNNAIAEAGSGDTILLNRSSFSTEGQTCISIINKSNITFDCQNYFLSETSFLGSSLVGVTLFHSDNNQIKNCNFSASWGFGITANYSNNNTFINIITSNNNFHGIFLTSSNNNTFVNITANYNRRVGIHLNSSNSNSFTSIDASYNSLGISINYSDNNLFKSIIANNNSKNGIMFTNSSQNNLIDSYIKNNLLYGLLIYNPYSSPYLFNYTIYNNSFNNTNNFFYNGSCPVLFFNTTKAFAKNIVGGDYTGGNFWGTPNNTGFSQNCTDEDNEGICDSPYNLSTNLSCIVYDYLPLNLSAIPVSCTEIWTCGSWGTCNSSGNQTRTCTDSTSCGTIINRPALVQSCTYSDATSTTPSGDGGSSGGGGSGASSTEGIGTQIVNNIPEVVANQPTEINIEDSQIYLTKLQLNFLESVQDVSVTVTKVNILNDSNLKIGLPSEGFYQAFEIETTGTSGSNIANVTLDFKVNKEWLANQNGTIDNIGLFRKAGTSEDWNALTTNYKTSDDTFHHFTSVSPGFSTFAIFSSCQGTECEKTTPFPIWIYGIILAVIILVIVSFIILRKIRKK